MTLKKAETLYWDGQICKETAAFKEYLNRFQVIHFLEQLLESGVKGIGFQFLFVFETLTLGLILA